MKTLDTVIINYWLVIDLDFIMFIGDKMTNLSPWKIILLKKKKSCKRYSDYHFFFYLFFFSKYPNNQIKCDDYWHDFLQRVRAMVNEWLNIKYRWCNYLLLLSWVLIDAIRFIIANVQSLCNMFFFFNLAMQQG